MTNTLDAMRKRDDESRKRAMFEDMIEHFTKTYRPADPYHAAEFDRMFFSLVRQIYLDAQQPALDRLTQIAMAAPMPHIFVPNPETPK